MPALPTLTVTWLLNVEEANCANYAAEASSKVALLATSNLPFQAAHFNGPFCLLLILRDLLSPAAAQDHLWRRFDPESHCILAATYRGQDNITVAYQVRPGCRYN